MNQKHFICILFLLVFSQLCACARGRSSKPVSLHSLLRGDYSQRGGYLVVAPKVVRPGLPYPISVSIFGSPWGADAHDNILLAEIREYGSNKAAALTWVTNVKPGHPITVPIAAVPGSALVPGKSYKLFVKAATKAGRVLFQAEDDVSINSKSLSVFVQTDKAVYKPGSTVRYRVVVINPELKPYNGNVSVTIYDPRHNVIQLHHNQTLKKGFLSKQLELSTEPPLGDWTIEVKTSHHYSFRKTFRVAKYALPKFEVTVEPPDYTTVPDDLNLKIKAKYTFGKGVQGKVTVRPEDTSITPAGPIEKTVELDNDGEANVKFTFLELFRRDLINGYDNETTIRFLATATEELTGIKRNGTGVATIFKHGIKIQIQIPTEYFKPGLDYRILVAVTTPNGDPIPSSYGHKAQLKLYTYDTTINETIEEIRNLTLENDGTSAVTLKPKWGSKWMRIEVHYDRKNNLITPEYYEKTIVFPSLSPSKTFLQLAPSQDLPYTPGQTAKFTVSGTEKLTNIALQVIARGDLILTKQIKALTGQNNQSEIRFKVTAEMAPKSRMVVYAVRPENNEILVDALDFKVTGFFQNNVSVKFDQESAQPGQLVKLAVTADPGSYVGLMAVDQSVKLLKSGNDITYDLVEEDIENYGLTGATGGNDAQSIFENAGLVVLTNGKLYDYEKEQREKEERQKLWGNMIPEEAEYADNDGDWPMLSPRAPPRLLRPSAARRISHSSSQAKRKSQAPQVRKKFPETWIWVSDSTGPSGELVYFAEVPDTITSWIASGFAVNDESGFGVSKTTSKLEVFRPFFIRPNLPYSVKRNEKLALQVLIYNYLHEDQKVTVSLDHGENSGFDFVARSGRIVKKNQAAANYNKRRITVEKDGGTASISFPVVATKVGQIKLKLTAVASSAADAVERVLLVEPEGIKVEKTRSLILDLAGNSTKTFQETVSMDFPGAIEGSEKAEVAVIGDVMGTVLGNLENLVKMPSGCGEQNMINFVPNIVVMRYLNTTNRLTDEIAAKAKKHMELGYQRELTFMRYDNSFSAFGNSDIYGSTWLTAFVLRAFNQAKPYIHIDQDILNRAASFLRRQQNSSTGAFMERGEVHHKALQGGARQGGIPLTAYVVAALLEHESNYAYAEWKDDSTSKAVRYLGEKLDEVSENVYALAITTYALHLANSPLKDRAHRMLENKASEPAGLKHWEAKVEADDEKPILRSPSYPGPRAADVEATAYALLTYVERNDVLNGIPVLCWLTSQRNANGGYSSTQDTVLALQALGAMAEVAFSPVFDIKVQVTNGQKTQEYEIKPENAIVLNLYEVPDVNSPVRIEASGKGLAFAQVNWNYHTTAQLQKDAPFTCTQNVTKVGKAKNRIEVSTCCKYNLKGQSNMALMQLEALSGYNINGEELEDLTSLKDVQRVDLDKGDTLANIYLNKMSNETLCLKISSDKTFSVVDHKPAQFRIMDYYSPEKYFIKEYRIQGPALSDICETCWDNIPPA